MQTFDASQTDFECSPYCSTSGNMLVVTIRCALLKFESISVCDQWYISMEELGELLLPCNVSVIDCSSFSSSSVGDKFLCPIDEPGRDMLLRFA